MINNKENNTWKSFNDSMVSDVNNDFIASISSKMKYDTPYILFYQERQPGARTKKYMDIKDRCDVGLNLTIPSVLRSFVETDSENYLKEKELQA